MSTTEASSEAPAPRPGSRRASRQRAVEVLFEADVRRKDITDSLARIAADRHADKVDPFARDLVQGVAARLAEIDAEIGTHARNWSVARMPTVDRNILRLAVYELLDGETSAAVVIDEAVELAKALTGDDAPRFVNGVLSAVARAHAATE